MAAINYCYSLELANIYIDSTLVILPTPEAYRSEA